MIELLTPRGKINAESTLTGSTADDNDNMKNIFHLAKRSFMWSLSINLKLWIFISDIYSASNGKLTILISYFISAFKTPTKIPYGTVNLLYGVPKGEITITCTAGAGTFAVEFGTLSRLTGDPIFEKTALEALDAIWKYRSEVGLVSDVESYELPADWLQRWINHFLNQSKNF